MEVNHQQQLQRHRLRRGGILAISGLMIAGLSSCSKPSEAGVKTQAPPTAQGTIYTVHRGPMTQYFAVAGNIKSQFNATLSSKAMGTVNRVLVTEGSTVAKGQLLLEIDSREVAASVNVAQSNYNASVVAIAEARTAAEMERRTSDARIRQAELQVQQAQASLAAAEARRDLAKEGTRSQEIEQAHVAVIQAESSLKLAKIELDRVRNLVDGGALARRDLDQAQNRYDLAKGQYESALLAENIAKEGSRTQEIREAEQSVNQARAALNQARAAAAGARAAALQVDVRLREIESAQAHRDQASAATQAARVGLAYSKVLAPFDGRLVKRMVDPGAMASLGVPLLMVEGGNYQFEAVVPEKYLSHVQSGMTLPVSVDALPGQAFSGQVVEILPQGDVMSHSFLVKVSLGMPNGIRSGMFGRLKLAVGTKDQISIPKSATWMREGLNYVFVLNQEGLARLRIVTLGAETDGQVEVLSGLNDGEKIVTGDLRAIQDGNRIEATHP